MGEISIQPPEKTILAVQLAQSTCKSEEEITKMDI